MEAVLSHSWNLSPKEAIELQKELASRILLEDRFEKIGLIAGADMAIDVERQRGIAGIVLFEFPSLRILDRVWSSSPLTFPYVPGLLSFREGPVLLKAFKKLTARPDLIFFDGQGVAHPRRLGIASHIGLLLDCPAIGCGKSLLCGDYHEPGPSKGEWLPLKDKGEVIGTILRSRDRVKPIFVSPGHKISMETSLKLTLQCCDGFRLPKPTRLADQWVSDVKLNNISNL